MQSLWIDDPAQLAAFCADIEPGAVIAVDTESDHYHAYQAKVCLIQLATPEAVALIDPLALTADDLAPFFAILEGDEVIKILHAAHSDIGELDRDYGLKLRNVFDTQVASRFLNYERQSLSWLQEELLGVKPGKQFQRFDWTTRPIPREAQRYATDDVIHLFALRDRFVAELEAAGWTDACAQQCEYIAATTNYTPGEFDPERWRRIKTSKTLSGRDRAALRELFIWRHEVCTELNQAALFVFNNASLVKVAQARPRTVADFDKIRTNANLSKARTHGLLNAIGRSLDAEIPTVKPPRRERSDERLDPTAEARYEALKAWRASASTKKSLPREFVATNATLVELAQEPPANLQDLHSFPSLLPWHLELFGKEILRTLAKL